MTEPPEPAPKITAAIRVPEGKSALDVTALLNTTVSPAAGAPDGLQFAPLDQLPPLAGPLHVLVAAKAEDINVAQKSPTAAPKTAA